MLPKDKHKKEESRNKKVLRGSIKLSPDFSEEETLRGTISLEELTLLLMCLASDEEGSSQTSR